MRILISQKTPSSLAPYEGLQKNWEATIDFHPFFLVKPLSVGEFRAEKINLADYSAVTFSSKHAIDAYFQLAEETRFKVPDTMKYFCITEAVAMYLQKHIVYRKRKIFYGTGTPSSVAALITAKHKEEKFLITAAAGANKEAITGEFDKLGLDYTVATLVKSVPCNLKEMDLHSYDAIVLYNSSDVESLYENYPDFSQGDIRFITFGKNVVKAMEDAGLKIALAGPSPEIPSAIKAIETLIKAGK